MRATNLLLTTLVLLGLFAQPPVLGAAEVISARLKAPGKKSANLREILQAGLRARRPEEFAFIDRVVKMVEQKELPEDLVRSTFDWARDKRPYQYPYFERGLKVRAARQGIRVH